MVVEWTVEIQDWLFSCRRSFMKNHIALAQSAEASYNWNREGAIGDQMFRDDHALCVVIDRVAIENVFRIRVRKA